MSTWTLGAPVWIAKMAAKRPTSRPTMSPFPVIVLLCGLAAPMLLARLELPTPAPSDHSPFDRRYFWGEAASIAPQIANAQIKRIAAARNVPYFVVRQLVDDMAGTENRIDVAGLNHALDRREQGR